MFRGLKLEGWRQFSQVEIDLHPRLTVLTGANGSGKTTILQLLNRHWGWSLHFVSTPRWDKRGQRKYWAGFWDDDAFEPETLDDSSALEGPPPSRPHSTPSSPPEYQQVGALTYANGRVAPIRVAANVNEVFNAEIVGQQPVNGVYVPSHRPPYIFQRVDSIPTTLDAKEQIFSTYMNEMMARFNASSRTTSPSLRIKTSLISLATFGYGNDAVDRNEDAIQVFEGFVNILKIVLPSSLQFRKLRVRVPDVLLDTGTGQFSFDAVSGGVAAIIDLAWQIYMYSQLHSEFCVVIDEPETHLHPALSQRLLPDLLVAFPKCQFVVATHNPLMVTSVADANIYVLRYNERQRVESVLLSEANKAGNADEILRDVLGVPFTMPIWAHNELQRMLSEFAAAPKTPESLNKLRSDMTAVGLGDVFPTEVSRVLGDGE